MSLFEVLIFFFFFLEKKELKSYLADKKVIIYKPSSELKKKYKDGGVAIIEQIICSHAK